MCVWPVMTATNKMISTMASNIIKAAVWGVLAVALSGAAYADSLPGQLLSAPQQAKQLLQAMCDAMSEQSYSGTFIHLHNNKIESMEIVRRKDARGELEKIRSLNGEAREIIRNRDQLTCILPWSKTMTVDMARPGSQLPLSLPQNLDSIEAFYRLSLDGQERIAGREADIVSLTPRDSYRYGHRIWVDRASRLMVKSDLLDEQGVPIEQIMFTALKVTPDLPDSLFAPNLKAAAFKRVEVGEERLPQAAPAVLEWQLSKIPYGFALVSHDRKMGKQSHAPVESMLLSDGMASVSVFIEPVQQGRALSGASRMGAVNAYGSIKDGHKIVVVGEVPAATVMLINQHVEWVQP